MQNQEIEEITHQGKILSIIIRSTFQPERTTFLTPPEFKQQVGFVVYPKGGVVKRHVHLPLERNLVGTSEVILVKRGSCLLDVFNDDRELVATRQLETGDLMLMVGGGHGFRIQEDTVLVEVKQGPYSGVEEKELF
jgi:hypothetical protein